MAEGKKIMGTVYLGDNYGPIQQEHTVGELPVTGTIPPHLTGRYLRNGPNPMAEADPDTYHWFMGDGMVHGVRLREGKALWYRNRWVRTPAVAAALGEPAPPHRAGVIDVLGANTNVIGHAGRTIALVEGGVANYELTEELDTVGPCDFDGTLPGGYTAHPKRDPDTGELHAVSYYFGWGNRVQYSVIDVDGHARRTVDVEVGGSPMMHDFSLTRNHVVLYDLPVTFDARQAVCARIAPLRWPARLLVSSLVGRVRVPDPIAAAAARRSLAANGRFPYRWNPKYPARIGVLPRDGGSGDVRWFDIDPCYVFHTLNAYDDGDTIVLDVARHPKTFATHFDGPGEGMITLDRWVVDLNAGKVIQSRLDDRPQEFPRVDERLVGRRHRYGYSIAFPRLGSAPDTLLKHDMSRGTTISRTFGRGTQVGEFVFEPNTVGSAEDDGVLMGLVYDAATERSDLVMLDAGTLDTVAAIHLPTRVPHGFHGNWVADQN